MGAVDLQRLVPVARPHARHRRQSVGCVFGALRVGVGERVPVVRDRSGEAALTHREAAEDGEDRGRDERDQRPAGGATKPPRGRAPGREEADREPRERKRHEHSRQQHAELVAGRIAFCERHVFAGERVRGEVERDDHRGAEPAGDEHGGAAQAQGHDAEPQHQPDQERRERAARVGQHERGQLEPHRRVGERAQQRVAVSPRAQPETADRSHRRRHAGRHPVAVGLLQARERFRGAELRREDLREQRVAGDHQRRERHAAEQRRPALRRHARERHGGREHAAVGEQAPRVLPARVRFHRPGDREHAEAGEGEQQDHRGEPIQRARAALVAPPRPAPPPRSPSRALEASARRMAATATPRWSTSAATISPLPIVSAISIAVIGTRLRPPPATNATTHTSVAQSTVAPAVLAIQRRAPEESARTRERLREPPPAAPLDAPTASRCGQGCAGVGCSAGAPPGAPPGTSPGAPMRPACAARSREIVGGLTCGAGGGSAARERAPCGAASCPRAPRRRRSARRAAPSAVRAGS